MAMSGYSLMSSSFRLSGGASNSDPALSIGGEISSEVEYSGQSAEFVNPEPNFNLVTLLAAGGNPIGVGELKQGIAPDFEWLEPRFSGEEFLTYAVRVTKNTGYYEPTIQHYPNPVGGDHPKAGCLTFGIDSDLFTTNPEYLYADVEIQNKSGGILPDVSGGEILTGVTRYRGLYLVSRAAGKTFTVGVLSQPLVGGAIAIGVAAEGVNTQMETLANDATAPSGVTFYNDDGLLPERAVALGDGDYVGIWLRHTVPAGLPVVDLDTSILTIHELEDGNGMWNLHNLTFNVKENIYAMYERLSLEGLITPAVSFDILLTGEVDLLPDYQIQATKFRFTKYSRVATDEDTITISVQESALDSDELFARPNGNLRITQTIKYTDAVNKEQVLIDLPFDAAILSKGGKSRTHVISGSGIVDYSSQSMLGTKVPVEISGKLINSGTVALTLATPESAMYLPNSSIIIDGESVDIHTVEMSIQPKGITTRLYR